MKVCRCNSKGELDKLVYLAQKRKILASAAAAGVSVAFGSPLGAVIFGLEGWQSTLAMIPKC